MVMVLVTGCLAIERIVRIPRPESGLKGNQVSASLLTLPTHNISAIGNWTRRNLANVDDAAAQITTNGPSRARFGRARRLYTGTFISANQSIGA